MSDTHHIGHNQVTLLKDGEFAAPTDVLIHADGEDRRRETLGHFPDGQVRIDVNCFLVRGPTGVTLIDSGMGPAGGERFGAARIAMKALGVTSETIDRVVVTHIHGDHVMGLLDQDAPWLPSARILVPRIDLDFFTDPAAREAQPAMRRGGFDAAALLTKVYEGRIATYEAGPIPGLTNLEAVPLPGHTPGHMGILVRGDDGDLLIWADTLHLKSEQTADPGVGLVFDIDSKQSLATRRAMLERAANDKLLVAGSHITGFGRIERAEPGYRFVPA